MILKRCPDCGLHKSLEDFALNRSSPDGRAFYCRACFAVRGAATYRRKQAKAGKTVRERVAVPEGHLHCSLCKSIKPIESFPRAPYQKSGRNSWCRSCKAQRDRASRFQRLYGMTEEALAERIASQGGVCAICRYRRAEHVDHDHVTGEVRGVLCFPCNAALGHFKDRIDLLASASRYLETSTWQKTRVCTGVFRLSSPRRAPRPSPTTSALQHLISSHRAAVTSPPV